VVQLRFSFVFSRSAAQEDAKERTDLAARISDRDSALDEALQDIRRYIAGGRESGCREVDWRSGGEREHWIEEAIQWEEVLQQNQTSRVQLCELKVLRDEVVDSRVRLVDAESELKKARLRGVQGEILEQKQEAYLELKKKARLTERRFAAKLSHVCFVAKELAPEHLAEIIEMQEDQVSRELAKFDCADQVSIVQLLSSRRLGDYDEELQNMELLSSPCARHRLFGTRYDGERCVLKAFELHVNHGQGLRSFLHEVKLHAKLCHPLIVPLKCAFLDLDSQRGFLHFVRYPFDVRGLMESTPTDNEVFRAVRAMVQSVEHLHTSQVIHGDLKPSNWLWDPHTKLPLLCDFETAEQHAADLAWTHTRSTTPAMLVSEATRHQSWGRPASGRPTSPTFTH